MDQLTISISRSQTTPPMVVLTISDPTNELLTPPHYVSPDELGCDYMMYTVTRAIRNYVASIRADQ